MAEEDSAETTIVTGLLHLLEPVTIDYDQRIRAVQLAQAELADRIDVLTKQITDCVAETEFVDVSPYLQKLVNSRKKIMNVATTLNNISERLARMNRQAQNKYPEMAKLRQSRIEKQKQLESPQTPVQTAVENTPEQPQTQQAEQE